jgi:tripartite-type tricarboxylate transporter receptor subunit TctC
MLATPRGLVAALIACACVSTVPVAFAQGKWPSKPIRMIVAFPPGGGTDVVARLLAPRLSEELGQSIVIDNRPGAAGTIGSELAVRATPDGYTLLIIPTTYASNATLYKLAFDPIRDITPVAPIGIGPIVLAVNPASKITSLRELVEFARANPGRLTFGSSGVGSGLHLSGELLQQLAGVKMSHVPFKGDGPALADLIGGHIDAVFGSAVSTIPLIRAGKLRGIAVTTEKRAPAVPELPAISEVVPGFASSAWFGIVGPARLPPAVVARMHEASARVVQRPDVLERLRADGLEPLLSTPKEFGAFVEREIAMWAKVIRAGNIRIE